MRAPSAGRRLLQLARPEADALGRPAWAGTPADVSRAYRRLSILVHPDKFSGDEAKQVRRAAAFLSPLCAVLRALPATGTC